METYNILNDKEIVSTVNVDNIEQALEAAADFAAANGIQDELTVELVITEADRLEEITESILEEGV